MKFKILLIRHNLTAGGEKKSQKNSAQFRQSVCIVWGKETIDMKNAIYLTGLLCTFLIVSCSQEKKLVRKASNAVERSDFDQAISYYDQALKKDSMSYLANAGKGVVLSEYVGRHQEAIIYLERALKKHPEKTGMKINYDLGKSYHFVGNYPRAIYFYGQTTKYNKEGSPDYDMFLNKRIADCKYALEHPEFAPVEEQEVKTVGNQINTSNPEYGAVYTRGKLIFTSKRKDDDKEKKNGLDGRYFDAMYVSTEKNGTYGAPRRFTVPDIKLKENFSKPHESVVSVSPDGNTLYIFREGQIYEADLNDSTKAAHKLDNSINFSYLQSHVTLSADGRTMIFSSEAQRGIGGLDLYKSEKGDDGKWSDAVMLSSLNTMYNEDSPYLNKEGVLFYSSNGLPGYGGYDVYRSREENGMWSSPVNLGQPINSPGDEMYFTLLNNTSNGYYTSVRQGGQGDLDIYKVHYVMTDIPECSGQDSTFAISAEADPNNQMVYNFSAMAPANNNKVKSYSWKLNGETLAQSTDKFQYTFSTSGTYTLTAKAVTFCDSCPSLIAMCSEKVLEIGAPVFASTDSLNMANDVATATTKSVTTRTKKVVKNRTSAVDLQVTLNDTQLKDLGWNNADSYFDYNQSTVREDARPALNQNINVLKKNKDLAVKINGYADCRGTDAYNNNLSLKRANAVKNYLIENGISKNRILAVRGFGESQPVNQCVDGVECSEMEHQQNRRSAFDVINLIKTPSEITFN